MDSRNRTKLQEQYGRCSNRNCTLYGQPQEVHHGDYTCSDPKCKKKLTPCAPPKEKKNKLPLIVGGVVLAIVIIVGGIFAFSGGKSHSDKAMVADSLQIADSADIAPIQPDTLFVRDTLVMRDTLVVQDTLVVRDTIVEKSTTAASGKQTPKATTKSSSSTNLSYGSWSGGMKNGQPHGIGTLTYSTSRTIDSRDPKGRVAQPGEYIVGEWDNGHLVQGRWFKKDGTKEAIIIGKAE